MRCLPRLAALLALPLLATACATPRSLSLETAQADPWEASNRRVYAFNKNADRYVMKPISSAYRAVVPQPGRRLVSNAYNNYGQPRYFLNYLLQGKIKRAFQTLDRFLLNTTLGVGGLADVATDLGRPDDPTDFGMTFSQWGIAAGPYVMLPFLGPSTLRDGVGVPFDFFVDPADIARNRILSPSIWWRAGLIGGRLIDARSRLTDSGADGLLASSLDEYATIRSAFLQSRRAQLYYGNPPLTAEELEYYGDDAVPESTEAPAPDTPAPDSAAQATPEPAEPAAP
ncbi:MlaA family lipoprotein [Polymorphobacter sp.]|uniref:MlaA family lipoprotein n=1 Tax=Polymorphobacter sp. TaxID=1909290 RepID=UPI003F726C06